MSEHPPPPSLPQKDAMLDAVTQLASAGALTRAEILAAYERGAKGTAHDARTHTKLLSELLYAVGGIIVLAGMTVLVAQNWSALSDVSQIAITLGSAIAAFIAGVLLTMSPNTEKIGSIFFLLSGLLAPVGIMITMVHGGYSPRTSGAQAVLSGILLLTYGLGRVALRQTLLTVFGILFGTWFFYAAATWLARQAVAFPNITTYYESLTLVAGLSHLFLGYALRKTRDRGLTELLYLTGLVAFLGAALALGGFAPNQSTPWELLFPGIVTGTALLSIPLKSRIFLFCSALYLVSYVFKITAEYFSDSFGWPLALVLVGFSIIGTGYATWALHRKYFAAGPRVR